LDSLVNLLSLSLWGNEIEIIEGLNSLVNLRELYLYKNNISKIENLESLVNLQIINIMENILFNPDDLCISDRLDINEDEDYNEYLYDKYNLIKLKDLPNLKKINDIDDDVKLKAFFNELSKKQLCENQTYQLHEIRERELKMRLLGIQKAITECYKHIYQD